MASMTQPPDVAPILQTAFSFWSSKVLLTAVEFGLFTTGDRKLTGQQRRRVRFLGRRIPRLVQRSWFPPPRPDPPGGTDERGGGLQVARSTAVPSPWTQRSAVRAAHRRAVPRGANLPGEHVDPRRLFDSLGSDLRFQGASTAPHTTAQFSVAVWNWRVPSNCKSILRPLDDSSTDAVIDERPLTM